MSEAPKSFADNVRDFARGTAAEFAALRPGLSLPALTGWAQANRADLAVAAILFLVFHQLYFWVGYIYMNRGAFYLPSDVIYGWDVPRVVDDIVTVGHNARSNVHPLFVLFGKPWGLFYNRVVGLSVHRSAVATTAMTEAFAVALAYAFLRLWGAARAEAALLAAAFGATAIGWFSGVVPETGAFAIVALTLNLLLVALTLRRGRRPELAWLAVGFFTYGITISNFLKTGFAHGISGLRLRSFRDQFAQTTVYCTLVVTAGVLATLAIGSSFNLMADKWIATGDEVRGGNLDRIGARVARAFFLYDIVAPVPSAERVTLGTLHNNDLVVSENNARYTPLGLTLAAVWVAALALNAGLVLRARKIDELRLLGICALWVAWDCVFFSIYYVPFEGVFHWTSHTLPPLLLSLAPLAERIGGLEPRTRRAAQTGIAVFVVLMAVNNFQIMMHCLKLLEL